MVHILIVFTAAIVAVAAGNNQGHDEIINKINKAQNSWTAGHNEILDKGFDYFMGLLGAELPNESILPVKNDIKLVQNIPKKFDARKRWHKCLSIPAIRDQGDCGSCWAVSTANTISDRLCIQSNYKVQLNISSENLLSCCETCVRKGKKGCDGGRIDYAWDYFQLDGLVTGGDYESHEGCQPYEIPPANPTNDVPTPPCRSKCTNKLYRVSYGKDKHYGKSSYSVPQDVAAIQTEILQNGPVTAGFIVYDDFMYYKKGVYHKTSDVIRGGHAIRIIGWGREGGDDYWLIANSWGRNFGENGTFKIRKGTNECSIESFVVAGLITPPK